MINLYFTANSATQGGAVYVAKRHACTGQSVFFRYRTDNFIIYDVISIYK